MENGVTLQKKASVMSIIFRKINVPAAVGGIRKLYRIFPTMLPVEGR